MEGKRAVACVVVWLMVAACGSSGGTPANPTAPLDRPHGYWDCGAASDPRGAEGNFVAGILWPSGDFPSGAKVTAYACIGHAGGQAEFLARGSATVRPQSVQLDPEGVYKLTFSATEAGSTYIQLTVQDGPLTPALIPRACKIVSDGTSWHFAPSS